MNKLLFLLAVPFCFFVGVGIAYATVPHGAVTVANEQVNNGCPQWICTPPPDTRTGAEYMAECQPVLAHPAGQEMVVSWWCTANKNPIDSVQQLPSDYVVLED